LNFSDGIKIKLDVTECLCGSSRFLLVTRAMGWEVVSGDVCMPGAAECGCSGDCAFARDPR